MVRPRPMEPFPKPRKARRRMMSDKQFALRGSKALKRGNRLRQRSPKKRSLHALYVAGLAYLLSLNPKCRICNERRATEGHHPSGQRGWLILIFIPICRTCHDWAENHKRAARDCGLIWYK